MRQLLVIAVTFSCGCATTGPLQEGGEPVSWSISKADSPQGSTETVCEAGEPEPCVLERSTPERPSYARASLHLWGPSPTTFRGSVLIGFLHDPDPRKYKSEVDLTSKGQDVNQHTFSRVTSVPGSYSVRIHLEETIPGLPQPRVHDLTVPVSVK
jgi:hypothetical protein